MTSSDDELPIDGISIVIEWENVLLSGESRADRMLERVIEQANRLPSCRELVISATNEQPMLTARPPSLRNDIGWRLLVNPQSHYYELKNLGACEAQGDVVVFVDSDVIPEHDWLEELVAPFRDTDTLVSCGRAYIEPIGVYNKAFALFWFFPVRQIHTANTTDWRHTHHFFANNIAFRKCIAIDHPFPADDASSRGACLELADSLQQAGINIVLNTRAQVAHPPPQPGEHFTMRALAQGRDRYLRSQGLSHSFLGSCWRWCRNSTRTIIKITWLHQRVGLPWYQIPVAWLLGLTYYSLYWLGEVATMLRYRPVLSITI